jgi:hypothetical protein
MGQCHQYVFVQISEENVARGCDMIRSVQRKCLAIQFDGMTEVDQDFTAGGIQATSGTTADHVFMPILYWSGRVWITLVPIRRQKKLAAASHY